MAEPLVGVLCNIVGKGHVIQDPSQLAALSSDVFLRPATDFVLGVAPGSIAELRAAVSAATAEGYAIVPRGGGLSYTGGYTPGVIRALVVDMRRLDQIGTVETTDSYVVVECGCTWRSLHDQLAVHGLRTPWLGPLSGAMATVGGALAQGAIYFGSTAHGISGESVLGLEVMLADGSVLHTGTWAARESPIPFFRSWGPDLTGLFLGDCGALGLKTRACLRLIPIASHYAAMSFAYRSAEEMLAALTAVAQTGLASECYGHDPWLTRLVRSDVEDRHTLNVSVEAQGEATLAEARQSLARLAGLNGEEIDAEPVRASRQTLFASMEDGPVVDADGARFIPINAVVPPSWANDAEKTIRAFMAKHVDLILSNRIDWGLSFFAVGASAVVIDILIRWREDPPAGPQTFRTWTHNAVPHRATVAVAELRAALTLALAQMGAANIQIGRAYPYRTAIEPASWALLQAIKTALDPASLINPGVLGLG